MKTFDSLPLIPELKLVVAELGFKSLTPIQEKSLPLLLEGRDLIGKSKTGSGKTLAFALPLLNQIKLTHDHRVETLRLSTLVLCPTRELCAQVAKEIRKLGRQHLGLRVLPLVGGSPMGLQIDALEQGVHIAVGTPGRVLDHLNRRTLDLRQISILVLDEADRMLEMGFQEEMEQIMDHLPESRQTVLFSATFPESIKELSQNYQKNATEVTVQDTEDAPLIEQLYYECENESNKFKTLVSVLKEYQPESTIVFCNMKITVDEVARFLSNNAVAAQALHGDLEQSERDRVMVKFRNRSIRVLVATDVAARGIDVTALDLVINFDLPKQSEIYTHRVGRTGRAGKTGVAASIIIPKEIIKIEMIETEAQVKISKKDIIINSNPLKLDAPMATLFISGGKRDKMRPGDILGALTGDAGLQGTDIGKIEIFDFFSYVAVSKSVAGTAISRLQAGKIKGKRFRIEPVK